MAKGKFYRISFCILLVLLWVYSSFFDSEFGYESYSFEANAGASSGAILIGFSRKLPNVFFTPEERSVRKFYKEIYPVQSQDVLQFKNFFPISGVLHQEFDGFETQIIVIPIWMIFGGYLLVRWGLVVIKK